VRVVDNADETAVYADDATAAECERWLARNPEPGQAPPREEF
jgi:hypothetical protein